jgi:hypothetical protein
VQGRLPPIRLSLKTTQPKNPKEETMQYKTIVLELLQQRPKMHDQLRKDRKLLTTMERYAKELKASHQAWKDLLSDLRPGSDPNQIATEALEIALKEMEDRLPPESPRREHEALCLDAAMLFLRSRHTRRE